MMILKQVNLSTILIFGSFLESFRSLSPFPSSYTNARSDHQTIKCTRICRFLRRFWNRWIFQLFLYLDHFSNPSASLFLPPRHTRTPDQIIRWQIYEDLSRPSSTSLDDDFETGESFNYSYIWIISRIFQVPFFFLLVTYERQIKSSDDKIHEDLSRPSSTSLDNDFEKVNLSTILIFGSFLEHGAKFEIWIVGNGSTKSISIRIQVVISVYFINLYNFNTNTRERGNHNEETNDFVQKNRIWVRTEFY